MVKTELGKLEKMEDLRNVWEHEAIDFTPWLAEEKNLALLSDAIGISIRFKEREAAVGRFSADIFAEEIGTERKIVIENQIEETDHNHLGKLITYAAWLNAGVLIWIVKKAKEEHRQAVRWLNDKTDSDIDVYLLEIELWRIGDSAYAPKFNIVESPNSWVKATKNPDSFSETGQLQLNFWNEFKDYASKRQDFKCFFPFQKIGVKSWHNLNTQTRGIYVQLRFRIQKKKIYSGIYITNNKPLYKGFEQKKDTLESQMGMPVFWSDAVKDSYIFTEKPIDPNDSAHWQEAFQWLCDTSLKWKACFDQLYPGLELEEAIENQD